MNNIEFADLKAGTIYFNDTSWNTIILPGRFDSLGEEEFDRALWCRKTFYLDQINSNYRVKIGVVDDMDATYINGRKIGVLYDIGVANLSRDYSFPAGLLVKGRNENAIRLIDNGGEGKVKDKIEITDGRGSVISLAGEWKSKLVSELYHDKFYTYGLEKSIKARPNISKLHSNMPTVLFIAMINPLVPYGFKGIIS